MSLRKSRRKMVTLGMVACLLLALSGTGRLSRAANGVLYAKPSPTGTGNCATWENACDLQTALGMATAGDEIWAAEGTHKPTSGTDRTATFQLVNGVGVYGGFAGTEASRDDRDWTLHETILSGDLGAPWEWDNSYHVVTGSGTDLTAILDGFTITGAYADDSFPNDRGGGMYNFGGSPTLSNLTFSGNVAFYIGGGMLNYDGSSPTLTNVTFSGNWADYGGGMLNDDGSNPTLTHVIFSGNWAYPGGGGMYNDGSSPTLTDVTFSGNTADDGGGMYNYESSPTLTDVTFSGNWADYGGGMYNDHSSPALTDVTFSGNYTESGHGGGTYSGNSSPTLTNVIFSGNVAGLGGSGDGGGMHSFAGSPTLTDVTFSGNRADNGGGMDNANSSPTLTNVIFSGNLAWNDGGGMCNWSYSSPTLTNVTFSVNWADYGGGMYNEEFSNPTLTNSILWGNIAATGPQVYNDFFSTPTISYSLVQDSGGSASWDSGLGTDGGGNIDEDPQFVDADGPDDVPGTQDDNLRLWVNSPAIDAGDNTADLDGTGPGTTTIADVATDLDGNPRIINGIVDMGPYEALIHVFLPLVLKSYGP
jgi:hypothetical protein